MDDNDGWKSDAVRSFEERRKNGKNAANTGETPGTWLVLGLAAPPVLLLPISGAVLMVLTYLQEQAVKYTPHYMYYDDPHPYLPTVVVASQAHETSLHAIVVTALIALALCAVPCLIGLKRYDNPKYLIAFASGFGPSYVGTALGFLHWFYQPSNPWISALK
jgi:hypothetical protein